LTTRVSFLDQQLVSEHEASAGTYAQRPSVTDA